MRRLLVLVAAASALLVGCGELTGYAAKVNGERISQAELERELDAILGNERYIEQVDQGFAQRGQRALGEGKGTLDSVFVARVLSRRIQFELIHQELERRKIRITPAELRAARSDLVRSFGDEKLFLAFPRHYRDELVRISAEVTALQRALSDVKVDEAAVRGFYEGNPQLFAESCVRHILVDSQEKAAEVRRRITAGEDFAAVARAESKDNQGPGGGSAARGGDLGCVTKGSFIPEFETAMDALQPGQVSDPVQSQFGFHIIQVMERRTKSLQEATPEILERLQQQSPDVVRTFVLDAIAKAKVVVNPRYGSFVKGATPGVVSPKELRATETTRPPAQAEQ